MAPHHHQHMTAVVALFLAALVLALPAAAYRPEAAGYTPATPAEATPTEAAVADGYTLGAAAASTPVEETSAYAAGSTPVAEATPTEAAVSTPAEATPTEAAVSTPVEATPTEAAVSTPAEAGTPAGYTPAAAAGTTTPAANSGRATTEEQKLMETVNAAYKKALDAANAAAPDDKFPVFEAAFEKGVKEGLADKTEYQRMVFASLVGAAIKHAYVSTSGVTAATEEQRFAVFVFTLTEALRVVAAALEVHAVKPAAEEAISGSVKAPLVEGQVIEKIDASVKLAAAAAKQAPSADKYLVFEATFSKAFKDEMGPGYDDKKAIPELNSAYKQAYKASVVADTPEAKFDAFEDALTDSIMAMSKAVKAAAGSKPAAAEATTEPAAEAAYNPAAEATTEPAAYNPAADEFPTKPARAKHAGHHAVGGYNLQ